MPDDDPDFVIKIDRGAPLVASWSRWAALAAGESAVIVGLAYAYVSFTKSKTTTMETMAIWLALGAASAALITLTMMRSEESRLARELRTARSGTEVIRNMVIQRRQKTPFFLKYLATTLGTAAVLVAESDKSGARQVLEQNSPLMSGGRLGRLREVIECDLERATGTSVGLERCIQILRAAPRIGNTEADRYKTHVLVKAVLQQGDGDTSQEVLEDVARSKDEEERLYTVWLRVWFEVEGAQTAIPEGELRLAALLARTHGAEELVRRLDARIAGLALPAAGAGDGPIAPPASSD